MMTPNERAMLDTIEAQEEIIKVLEAEMRKIAKKNLQLRTHLQILTGTPTCRTAEKVRQSAGAGEIFSESIINLN